jgi:signal transduction histidine kinase
VARNVGQITTLVNDILFLQEIELLLPEFQPVDLLEIVRLVVNRYHERAGANHSLITLMGESACVPVAGDAKSLERAIMALIDNAMKFSPQGGEVEIGFTSSDEHLILAFQDHGIGIEPGMQAHIFDRFYHNDRTRDELFGGLGIGLAITRQVIAQHHGKIRVASVPGQGSTFTVTLPTWTRHTGQLPPMGNP